MPDFLIADHGSIVWIVPVTDAARHWLDDNATGEPWQWRGGALSIDHRVAQDLIRAIAAASFVISS